MGSGLHVPSELLAYFTATFLFNLLRNTSREKEKKKEEEKSFAKLRRGYWKRQKSSKQAMKILGLVAGFKFSVKQALEASLASLARKSKGPKARKCPHARIHRPGSAPGPGSWGLCRRPYVSRSYQVLI